MQNITNSGNYNSGSRNSGNRNSGSRNSGDCNSGFGNSGNLNSGFSNSGDYNSGFGNSGNRNSGFGNSGDYNSGYFNTHSKIFCFNQIVELSYDDYYLLIPLLDFNLTQWILPENMSEEEKTQNPKWETCEGYLKTYEYKEAWQNSWNKLTQKNKQKFLDLPNFDAKIFEEITGINVKVTTAKAELLKTIQETKQKLQELETQFEKM
jgi:Pentapeptide repeats (8 copies)